MFGISFGWLVAAVLGGIIAARFAKRADDSVEERRENTLKVARVLEARGFQILPDVLHAYAIGNYSKVAKVAREAAITLTNPASADAAFEAIWQKQLAAKLANAETKSELERLVVSQKATPTVAPKNATAASV